MAAYPQIASVPGGCRWRQSRANRRHRHACGCVNSVGCPRNQRAAIAACCRCEAPAM